MDLDPFGWHYVDHCSSQEKAVEIPDKSTSRGPEKEIHSYVSSADIKTSPLSDTHVDFAQDDSPSDASHTEPASECRENIPSISIETQQRNLLATSPHSKRRRITKWPEIAETLREDLRRVAGSLSRDNVLLGKYINANHNNVEMKIAQLIDTINEREKEILELLSRLTDIVSTIKTTVDSMAADHKKARASALPPLYPFFSRNTSLQNDAIRAHYRKIRNQEPCNFQHMDPLEKVSSGEHH